MNSGIRNIQSKPLFFFKKKDVFDKYNQYLFIFVFKTNVSFLNFENFTCEVAICIYLVMESKIFFNLKYIKISFLEFFLFLILVNYNNKKTSIKKSI